MTLHKITELYSRYFQKSMVFILPLSGIPNHAEIKPIKSYLQVFGLSKWSDPEIILEFERSEEVESFLKKVIAQNPRLTRIKGFSRTIYVHVDLSDYQEEYNLFLSGKYSLLSPRVKQTIMNFHSSNKANEAYLHSFLFPERYFKQYAQILDVSEALLISVGELVDLPDKVKESFFSPDLHTRRNENGMSLTYLPGIDKEYFKPKTLVK